MLASPGTTRAGDEIGHGTHVAGIIAGNSFNRPVSDPARGGYVGIAPEADLIAIKVADDEGYSTVLDVIGALEFAVEHKDELNIRVINLSVSSDTPASYLNDPLDAAVEFAWHAGIVVVTAAGNRGDAADAVRYPPGNDPYVISVGATDEVNTVDPGDDTLAAFSSRGSTQDGFAKPDVLAPGAHIVAPLAMGSAFQSLCPHCVVGSYMRMGGTSAAAPVVSGAAALILQARPELNPDEVKQLLTAQTNPTAARPVEARPVASDGPPPVRLGTADRFAVLAGSTVTNTGPSTINGDLGLSPGTAVTGFPPGTVNGTTQAANAVALEAKADLTAAYDNAVGRTRATPAPADLGGRTLTPGVYQSASSLALTGELELDAKGDPNAVFVFQAGSTLISASASRVRLVNGAQPCNVFWQVGSSATLGTTTNFAGNILALTSITMNDGVKLNGRALARNGAVTLIDDTITAPHCATASASAVVPGSLRELDVSRALAADPGAGANQGVTPNRLVEQVLVDAGVDPTRAQWTRAQWTRAQWTRAQWTRAQWTRAQWTRAQWTRAQWTRACAACP